MTEDEASGSPTREAVGGLTDGFAAAGDDIDAIVRRDILPSVALIEEAVRASSRTIGDALVGAAETGRLSFKDMTRSILEDLSRIAVDRFVRNPIERGLQGVFSSLPFGGARASGGAVAPGSAYLVGERGPEIFAPSRSGEILPAGASGRMVTVNMNFPSSTTAESFQRSETQIAALLNRAVTRGSRNL